MQAVNRLTHPNPMPSIVLPKKEKKKAKHLEVDALRMVFEAVENHLWLGPLVNLDLPTGCRRGELLAVTWADLNFGTRFLRIHKSLAQTPEDGIFLKSTKEGDIRPLRLPPATIKYLRTHKKRQDAHIDLYRRDLNLIICDQFGNYLRPDSVSAKMAHLLQKKLGLPKGNSLHTVRHSSGSHLLSGGAPLLNVSQRLGHANTQITAELYLHALEADDPVMDEALEKLIAKTKRKPPVRLLPRLA